MKTRLQVDDSTDGLLVCSYTDVPLIVYKDTLLEKDSETVNNNYALLICFSLSLCLSSQLSGT